MGEWWLFGKVILSLLIGLTLYSLNLNATKLIKLLFVVGVVTTQENDRARNDACNVIQSLTKPGCIQLKLSLA